MTVVAQCCCLIAVIALHQLPPPTPYVSGHREGSRWLSLPISLHMQLVGTLSSQSQVPGSLGAAPRNAQDIHPSIHPPPPPQTTGSPPTPPPLKF